MSRARAAVAALSPLLAGALGLVLPPLTAVVGVVLSSLAGVTAIWLLERRQRRRLLASLGDASRPGTAPWSRIERLARERTVVAEEAGPTTMEPPWWVGVTAGIEDPALVFGRVDERLLAANEAAHELLGIAPRAEAPGMIQALGSSALAGAAREAGRAGHPVQVDASVGDRDLRATASPVGDEILVLVTDRTGQRLAEERRRNFVVNASHELKTPATAIQSLADGLGAALEHAPDRVPRLVAHLRDESDRLVRTVHDLLDLRRLEDGGPMERVPVDVAALARDVLTDAQAAADRNEVELHVELPDAAHVAGVPEDLRLVITNLVTNAIQYNRPGGRVTVSLRPEDGTHVLTVSDTGIGIPKQDIQRVFERFYRVDVARSRARGGTGLGLAIVRHAVERHGGSVRIESLLGEGSTFTVRLPIEPPA